MLTFYLDGPEFIELNKLLKVTGLCQSGGMAKTLIGNGCVRVDGVIERRKRCKIYPGQIVSFNEHHIRVT
ncbi:MAG: RNA-binding S4 domain-containing protein [Deltaproteobacteria bacterium]|nr:RNA-binding S4 domain-containing protein [Deltaproteobacteria bacterium]MBW2519674.1 RNA-binding S4 domain-containing protein [Deltaproteobacteria bacterium]